MTSVIRPTGESRELQLRSPELEAAMSAIEAQLSALGEAPREDTEWVVDLRSHRVVRRAIAERRRC